MILFDIKFVLNIELVLVNLLNLRLILFYLILHVTWVIIFDIEAILNEFWIIIWLLLQQASINYSIKSNWFKFGCIWISILLMIGIVNEGQVRFISFGYLNRAVIPTNIVCIFILRLLCLVWLSYIILLIIVRLLRHWLLRVKVVYVHWKTCSNFMLLRTPNLIPILEIALGTSAVCLAASVTMVFFIMMSLAHSYVTLS